MRVFSRVPAVLLLLCALAPCALISSARAQTYNPKTIRIDAPAAVDTAEALHIAALPTGVPLTKQEIEAALQRLIDTGLFSDVAYTVNSDALVIKLTPAASSQSQLVHFSNFVWWQPAELESLLEASVPAYHGKLPLAGTLTDQVEAALVSLLRTRGIDAAVTSRQSPDGVTLYITRPPIVIGDVQLHNTLPSLAPQLKTLEHRLQGQDFDIAETTSAIQDSANDIYQNAGYLDVSTSAASYSPPRKDLIAYSVDVAASIQPGEIYRVSRFSIQTAPPVSQAELQQAAAIKTGDPASPLAERTAQGEMQQAYSKQGYYDAKATIDTSKDSTAHTVAYTVTIAPGELYHLAGVDTFALPPDQQTAFAQQFHVAPGAAAGTTLNNEVAHTLNDMHALRTVKLGIALDRTHHTVTILLKPSAPHN